MEMLFAFLLLVTFLSSFSTASNNCKTSGSFYGVAHLGHVYKYFTVDRLATCYSACNSQPACQSLNYNLADKTCYFNRIAKRSEDLVEMESFVYAENPNRDPWIKLDATISQNCFAAKDDQFGRFWIPFDGYLTAFKLVHLSGTVSCNINREGSYAFWGCAHISNLDLMTIITNSSNHILLPENKHFPYRISGYHANSSEVVFPDLLTPLPVTSGQELRLWYSEDWKDYNEGDNDGISCADVYAKFM